MKLKLLLSSFFLFLLFKGQTFAQDEPRYALYSEITSPMRGNRSANLTFEVNKGQFKGSLGLDYYFGILADTRDFRKDALSFGITARVGFDPLPRKKDMFGFGLMIKQQNFHIYQLDEYDGDNLVVVSAIYKKDYQKIIPMIFVQINTYNTNWFYAGVQGAIGRTFLYNLKSEESDYEALKYGTIPLFDLNFLSEHGFHKNASGFKNTIAFQANFLFGIWF
ncbi:MAG: hypothetical protein R2879_11490 [Saprospiraceae bacterium]